MNAYAYYTTARKGLILLTLITIVALVVVIAMNNGVDTQTIAECINEDGSSQDICQWHYEVNGQSRTLINHNYGEFTYYPQTDTWITWDSAPSAQTVIEAARG